MYVYCISYVYTYTLFKVFKDLYISILSFKLRILPKTLFSCTLNTSNISKTYDIRKISTTKINLKVAHIEKRDGISTRACGMRNTSIPPVHLHDNAAFVHVCIVLVYSNSRGAHCFQYGNAVSPAGIPALKSSL